MEGSAPVQEEQLAPPTNPAWERNQARFEVELEFVQCLANPFYLASLATFFSDEAFLNYLKYLLYWSKPAYARFLQYPQALHHLHLLQLPRFREALAQNQAMAGELAGVQVEHWATWREGVAKDKGASTVNGTAGGPEKDKEETNGDVKMVTEQFVTAAA